ncbi:MAG: acyltransferase family protein [Bacillus sp. (in: Bacteria)]|nr:acyltransferase family protein [Bacillus sp. (in: firmicutes)]MCM1425497.1 acyltransferase family protein [Eubacterium sp.]
MNNTIRNTYMDFLKGVAIIAMVMGHCLSDIPEGGVILCNVIYSFHMPLLMFVSAYIEEHNREKYVEKEWEMLFKRACGLLIPYVSWSFLYEMIAKQIWEMDIRNFILQLTGYEQSGLWFLPVLFGLKIMHCLYWRIQKAMYGIHCRLKNILILCFLEAVVVSLAVLIKHPYIINMISYAIPYFMAVIIIDNETVRKIVNSEWMIAGVFFVYLLLFPLFSFSNTHWTTQLIRTGLSLCIIMICYQYQEKWKINQFYKILCLFGKYSLAIYVLYGFFIDSELHFSITPQPIYIILIVTGISAFIISGICVGIAKIIEVSSWWSKILFGK